MKQPPPPANACFAGGTPIATPTGEVAIENVRIGDRVQAYDFHEQRVTSAFVTDTMVHRAQPVVQFESPEGLTLYVTPNHPIYSAEARAFRAAGELEGRVTVLELNSFENAIEMPVDLLLTREPEPATVYNLTVDGLHNYFAGGVLVHNKERCWTNSSGCYVCVDSVGSSCPPVGPPPRTDASMDGGREPVPVADGGAVACGDESCGRD